MGIAPLAATTYKPGDQVTLSLVFDEIVDGTNSSLDDVLLNTCWGRFTYSGGADLYYSADGSSAEPFTYNGGALTFIANRTHTANDVQYAYQWYDEDGQEIPGATGQSYTISAADAGKYGCSCIVTATDSSGLSFSTDGEGATVIQKQNVPVPEADNTVFIYNGQNQLPVGFRHRR